MTKTPVRPPLALTIGVVGHRPNRLPEAARETIIAEIGKAVAAVADACDAARSKYASVFADGAARPVLLSALAEGADRYAAAAALGRNMALAVALPFPIEEYAKDFADDASRDEYRRLLAAAGDDVLVLPGDHATQSRPYETVGVVILENADVILAVWDEGPSAGKGGTTDLIERAAAMGTPIIHVDAFGKAPTRLIWSGLAPHPIGGDDVTRLPSAPLGEAIGDVVDRIVRPPVGAVEQAHLRRFLHEKRRRLNWRIELPLMLAILGVRRLKRTDFLPETPEAISRRLLDLVSATPAAGEAAKRPEGLGMVAEAFGFADAIGVRCGQVFRSSYVSRFLLAALAVIAAAMELVGGQIFGWTNWPLAVAQMVLVAIVLINTVVASRRDLHGRWRESREVAERLRAAIPSWLLAQVRHESTGAEPAWTGWYARAHLRALGLWRGALDQARLAEVRAILSAFIDDQLRYHTANASLMHAVERRLENVGLVLFVGTLALASADLALALLDAELSPDLRTLIAGLTAGLPALGGAFFGIWVMGDFEGTASRSAHTAATLAVLKQAVAGDPSDLATLRVRAAALGDAMIGDVSHWRLATETRRLSLLG